MPEKLPRACATSVKQNECTNVIVGSVHLSLSMIDSCRSLIVREIQSSSLLCSCGKHMFRIYSTSTNSGRKNSRAVDEHCEWIVMSRHFICIHASYIYIRIHIRHMYQYASTFVLSILRVTQDISRHLKTFHLPLPVFARIRTISESQGHCGGLLSHSDHVRKAAAHSVQH